MTLIRCGGHFPGSTVLHWAAGADGRGALLTGDTLMVASDRRYVSFMYSIVNLIPMSPGQVRRIVESLEPFEFDRLYSLWNGHTVTGDAKGALELFDSALKLGDTTEGVVAGQAEARRRLVKP